MVNAMNFIPILTSIGCILIISSMIFKRLDKKWFSLISLFFGTTMLIGSIIIFTYGMAQLTEIGVGGFFGSGNQYVNIPREKVDVTLFCSWGPSGGFYLSLLVIVLLIFIVVQYIKHIHRKRINLFWYCIDIICCKVDGLGDFYERIIGREYKKENKIFDISKSKNILHIGCGAYPITALILANNYDANIVAIDRNPKAVQLAKYVVDKKNLGKKIAVGIGKGEEYPVENFDTIIVSSCSVPKIKVLEHVFGTVKSQSKIIVRVLEWEAGSVINYIDGNDDVSLVKKIDNSSFPCFRWSSLYCSKK